jgi:FkbM family methyltransferase
MSGIRLTKTISSVNNLKFEVTSDLEKYRVESLLTKEAETIAWIDKWTNEEKTHAIFYDIGANIGIYSLYAASKNPNVEVYAFEPVSCNYVALLRNISINPGISINAYKIALSDKNSLTNLYLSDDRPGNSGAQIDSATNEYGEVFHPRMTEKVLCFSLDFLTDVTKLPQPSYIKIDVDGREENILNGMSKILKDSNLKSFLVEFTNLDTLEVLQSKLVGNGFSVDQSFDRLHNHSNIRRASKIGSPRNIVFSRVKR